MVLLCFLACAPKPGSALADSGAEESTPPDSEATHDSAPGDETGDGPHSGGTDTEDSGGSADDSAAPDADGDGYPADEDCDDGRADVHPGAEDPNEDGLDADCGGDLDACRRWTGERYTSDADGVEDGVAGYWVAVGDIDGDGVSDVLTGLGLAEGSLGAVYGWTGWTSG